MRKNIYIKQCCYLCDYFFEAQVDEGYCEKKDKVTLPTDWCEEFEIDSRFKNLLK
jgi:hypothetical protein